MALRNEKIAVIGCGTMGEAIVKGLLRKGSVTAEQIVVSHPRSERCDELAARYEVAAVLDNAAAVDGASMVVIAVKPQYFDEVAAELRSRISPEAIVVSIVAGIQMAHIGATLSTPAVVRVMPNTPGQIGRGISVWTASDEVDAGGRERAATLLGAFGRDEYVSHENEIDMATLAKTHRNLHGVITGKAIYEGKIDLAAAIAAAKC